MTAHDLAARLEADIRRIRHEGQQHDVERRIAVHCINETVRWMERRSPQVEQPQGAREGTE